MSRGETTTLVTVRLPDEVLECIKENAAVENLSAGLWIRKAVIGLVEQLATPEGVCSG
jgi:predicted DNA binding CopG/RHH family protein